MKLMVQGYAEADEIRNLARNLGGPMMTGNLRLRVICITRGADTRLLSRAMAVMTGLRGLWYHTDNQIVELQCRKRQGDHPRMIITLDKVDMAHDDRGRTIWKRKEREDVENVSQRY